MNGWKNDKRWSDRFIPEIKSVLAQHLISESPIEEDQEHNTDLIVLTLRPYRVACRIRRHEYYQNYKNEFTIRAGRPSGCKTELQKIIEGWGDYFFYGFSDQVEKNLLSYFLGDLKVFRIWFNRRICMNKGNVPGKSKNNKDNSSYFMAFDKDDLPNDFLITCKIQ